MKNKTLYIVFIILSLNGINASAETLNSRCFNSYKTESGLPHNEVRVITKCSSGFIWLGTQNGLSRYDGYRFKNYKSNKKDSLSIVGDKVYSIASSTEGRVWVGTTQGLSLYNPSNDNFSQIGRDKGDDYGVNSDMINSLHEDSSNKLFIRTSRSIIYDIGRDSLYTLDKNRDIVNVLESKSGSIFAVKSDGTALIVDRDYKTIASYKIDISTLHEDKFGTVWGCGEDHIYRYSAKSGRFNLLDEISFNGKITKPTLSSDSQGNIIVGGYGSGIYTIDRKTLVLTQYISNPELTGTVSSNDIYSLYRECDSDGPIFIGTQAGLDIFDINRHHFKKWQHIPTDKNSIDCSFVQAIYRDSQDRLWIGTRDNGLELVDSKRSSVIDHLSSSTKYVNSPQSYISSIVEDSRGTIWVTTFDHGIYYILKGEYEFNQIDHNSNSTLLTNSIFKVIEDSRGRLWFGTSSGVAILENFYSGDSNFTTYRHDPYNTESLSLNSVYSILEDSKGRVWLGVNGGGINLIHEEESTGEVWFEQYMHNQSDSTSISSNEVFIIFEDSKSRIWIGTSSGGVNLLIESGDSITFKHYKEVDGLADNEVNAFLEDKSSSIWISTNKGISKLDSNSDKIINFDSYCGVLEGKFRKNSAWRDSDGLLYFGGTDGINRFYPEDIISANSGAPTISQIEVDGEPLPNSSLYRYGSSTNDPTLKIESKTGHIKILLSTTEYSVPLLSEFYYSLDNMEWSRTSGSNPEIELIGLNSGNHKIVIRTGDIDNSRGEIALSIDIKGGEFTINIVWLSILIPLILAAILLKSGRVYRVKGRSKRDLTEKIETETLDSPLETLSEEEIKYNIDCDRKIEHIKERIESERLYKNHTLGLKELSDITNISPNELSHLLNSRLNSNFYDLINSYRIEEVKRALEDPANIDEKLLSIAWDCGFNSKSVFYRVFKQSTNMTPSQYQKRYCRGRDKV